jgi:ABC-type spermidine/putrescine transport system permease subunit II
MTLETAFGALAGLASVSPAPSPEGCHPVPSNPGVINCNFDRQEAQISWTVEQLSYVLMAFVVVILVIAIYSLATGRNPIPLAISRHLRRVPASHSDQRWLSASAVIVSIAVLVSLATTSLTFPGGFGHPAGPLYGSVLEVAGPIFMLVGLIAGMSCLWRVRYLDRRNGSVSSAFDQLFGRAR